MTEPAFAPGGDKARFVRSMFDAIAARYDLMNRLMTGGRDEAWRRLAADAVFPEVVERAIDIGAGTGDLSFALARQAAAGHVLALDFSEGMLRLGDEKRRRQRLDQKVQPALGDGMALPVGDDTVDAIVTGFTMRNVNEVGTVFAECFRALRPGGRLAVLELTPVETPIFSSLFRLYFHRLVPLLGALVSGKRYAYQYLPESVLRFPNAETLAQALRGAGFADVTYRKLALGTVALHVAEKASPAMDTPPLTGEGKALSGGGVFSAVRVPPPQPSPAEGGSHPAAAGAGPAAPSSPQRGEAGRGVSSTPARHLPQKVEPAEGALSLREVADRGEWDALLAVLPNAHVMQSWEWGEMRRFTGWVTRRLAFERGGRVVAAASVQRRALGPALLGIAYCPKGPALDYADTALLGEVLSLLAEDTRSTGCVFLSVEPEVEANLPGVVPAIRGAGYRPSANQLQANATVLVDVEGTDEALLKRMSSTWRRYINRAPRDGVSVRPGGDADVDRFYSLYRETSIRDGFVARPRPYLDNLWRHLAPAGLAHMLLAEVGGEAVGGVILLRFGTRALYLYGATSAAGQKVRAGYPLQWEAMRWARDHGCTSYDMWGAPDDPAVEDDPLAGVYYFKRGFGGRHVRWVGGYDYVASPALHWLWQRAVPRAFAALRRLRGERGAPVHGRALGA